MSWYANRYLSSCEIVDTLNLMEPIERLWTIIVYLLRCVTFQRNEDRCIYYWIDQLLFCIRMVGIDRNSRKCVYTVHRKRLIDVSGWCHLRKCPSSIEVFFVFTITVETIFEKLKTVAPSDKRNLRAHESSWSLDANENLLWLSPDPKSAKMSEFGRLGPKIDSKNCYFWVWVQKCD